MKNRIYRIGLFIFVLVLNHTASYAWGVYGHRNIIMGAILDLPPEMGMFFYAHLNELEDESVAPDIRKYAFNDKAEFPRHYMNVEAYENGNWNAIPRTLAEAKVKYDSAYLVKNGILPWYMQIMMERLTKAMKEKNKDEMIVLLGDLCHYIADSYMPLHTSSNHNGQLSGQEGIHGLWESQLPEMFGSNYNLFAAPARFIPNLTDTCMTMVMQCHLLVKPMLEAHLETMKAFNKDSFYARDAAGAIRKTKFHALIYSADFASLYNKKLKGMVELQMRNAIAATASFWYTAWVNAGKPNLDAIDADRITIGMKHNYRLDHESYLQGHIKAMTAAGEYQ
jgi:hypothetical protein